MRPGRADRFLAPKSEGERDLVSPGMIAAGCRRPDGLWEGKVKANISPKGGRDAEILGSGIFPS